MLQIFRKLLPNAQARGFNAFTTPPTPRVIIAPKQPLLRPRLSLNRRPVISSLLWVAAFFPLVRGADDMHQSTGHQRLVDHLILEGLINDPRVEQAFRAVDRRHFTPDTYPDHDVYMDAPLPLDPTTGQTISAPHMHATAASLGKLHLCPGARVLDVGSGSGYLTAVFAKMVEGEGGKVVGVERFPQLVEYSLCRLRTFYPDLLSSHTVEIREGNVLGEGLEGEPDDSFDFIHVGAAADTLPRVLVQKLKRGGRMIIPVGAQWNVQYLQAVDKDQSGHVKKKNLMGVRYVPLTRPGQDEEMT